MSKQNREDRKTRVHSTASAGRKPIAFARLLAASSASEPAFAPTSTPAPPTRFSARFTQSIFIRCIRRFGNRFLKRHGQRRKLELQEIQQLGEKRFLAIVRVGKQKFLIGGATASVSLLAEIHGRSSTVVVPGSLGQESA